MTRVNDERVRASDESLGEHGAALVLVLIAVALLTALGVSLLVLADTDARIAWSYQAGTETFYAADAAFEWALQELGPAAWSDVLSGRVQSSMCDVTRQPTSSSGERIDLDAVTRQLQAQSNAAAGLGANNPLWRLYAWGPLARMAGLQPGAARTYIAVWVADDLSDADDDPSTDANGIVQVHAEAFGPAGTRRIIEGVVASYWPPVPEPTGTTGLAAPGVSAGALKTVSRGAGSAGVRLLAWREVR